MLEVDWKEPKSFFPLVCLFINVPVSLSSHTFFHLWKQTTVLQSWNFSSYPAYHICSWLPSGGTTAALNLMSSVKLLTIIQQFLLFQVLLWMLYLLCQSRCAHSNFVQVQWFARNYKTIQQNNIYFNPHIPVSLAYGFQRVRDVLEYHHTAACCISSDHVVFLCITLRLLTVFIHLFIFNLMGMLFWKYFFRITVIIV